MPQPRKALSLDLAAIAWDIATVPYSVARADALDRIRESGPDVAVEEDEGGGVHVRHDPAARSDLGIYRGVPVMELAIITDPAYTIGEIAHLAAEIQALGVKPCVRFHRNEDGRIDGFSLCREMVA